MSFDGADGREGAGSHAIRVWRCVHDARCQPGGGTAAHESKTIRPGRASGRDSESRVLACVGSVAIRPSSDDGWPQEAPFQSRQFQIVGVAEPASRASNQDGRRTSGCPTPCTTIRRRLGIFSSTCSGSSAACETACPSSRHKACCPRRSRTSARTFNGSGPGDSPDALARYIDAPLILRSAENGPSPLRRQFERPLWILAIIAMLVLLIAGSNVANLFLARTARAGTRDVAAPVDWRRARAPDPAGPHRNALWSRLPRVSLACSLPGPRASHRQHAGLTRMIRCRSNLS